LFGETVLRRDEKGNLWLMNHAEKGWASYAIPVERETDVLVKYNAVLGTWSEDVHGLCAPVVPRIV
jgi:hypothetical protein